MSSLTLKIAQSGFRLPNGVDLETALPYLLESLGSADSDERSAALSTFNHWISSDYFSAAQLGGVLLEKSLEGIRYKLGASGDDSVFVRSYFALLLLALLHHNLENTIFDDAELEMLHGAVTETFLGEQDYRAVIPGKG